MATISAPLFGGLKARRSAPRFEECSDETLAGLVAEASEPAFAALYERHHQALYRYCRSIVRDDTDAQDVLQSAWTRALVALRRQQREAPVRPWLYRIVHNEAVSLLRRRGRPAEPPAPDDGRVASAEDRAIDRERFSSLLADLRELPERPRGALLMRELSGLSHEEIAVALDTSVSAAKQCIYEARRDLAELAAGRATPCDDICRRLSDGDRRVLRARRVSAHLRDCPSCAAFASTIDRRGAALQALAPWLPAAAATTVLGDVLRAGRGAGAGAGAAGTSAAVGGVGTSGAAAGVGTSGGAAGVGTSAGAGAAGTSAVATPAAVTAGVVTKAVGVPLLAKSLVAVVAVAAGVASVTGSGNAPHAASRPAPVHAAPTVLDTARTVPSTAARHITRRTPAAAASHVRTAHGHPAARAAHNGRHLGAGHASNTAPGQAEKAVAASAGPAQKPAAAPPSQVNKTATTAPGQATKAAVATSPGQTHQAATTPRLRAPRALSTWPGQARHVSTSPPGQTGATPATDTSAAAHAK